MTAIASGAFHRVLVWWVGLVCRRAWIAVAATVLFTAMAGWYVEANLAISTRTTDLLSGAPQFGTDGRLIDRLFPQHVDNIVVVVDGATPDQTGDAADVLTRRLRLRPDLFAQVFDPAGDDYFRRNGLLYLDADELSKLLDRLAGAQAFLGKLWRDPSLRGLFAVIGLALDPGGDTPPPVALATVLDAVADTIEAQRGGRPGLLSWREILNGGKSTPQDRRRLIVVTPVLDFAALQPASRAIDQIRRLASELKLDPSNGVRVRLTGSAPMAGEELRTFSEGIGLAGAVSLTLVLVLLLWGLRSPRLVFATLATLVVGLVWTAAFATAAVGRLNLISVAFAVLFIGLSIDFGIHFVLRYREAVDSGGHGQALQRAVADVGGALTLAAVAAAIAFLSFLPTDFVALAELGLIAGGGMFIALFANLTVLPALVMLLPPRAAAGLPVSPRMHFLTRRPAAILAGALLIGVAAATMAPRAEFDFDPLNLRNQSTESVTTLIDLMKDEPAAAYSATILAASLDQAVTMAEKLEKLDEVKSATTLANYLPKGQGEKLQMIEQAARFLLPAFGAGARVPPPSAHAQAAALITLRPRLAHFAATAVSAGEAARGAARHLYAALSGFSDSDAAALADLERRLLSLLPNRLRALRASLAAEAVTLKQLPARLSSREVAADGSARIKVYPRDDLRDPAALRRFVGAVRSIAPAAAGSPVAILEAGNAVVGAFREAAGLSLVLILLLVIALLRSVRDALLVFAPLSLAALLTIAASVLLDLAFNFANVIVLPLLFGLGVASSIHYVVRARGERGVAAMLATSTPRAVVFSALTTIGWFGSLALSSHPGISSMGVLLTVAIGFTLICTLLVLPALMALFARRQQGAS